MSLGLDLITIGYNNYAKISAMPGNATSYDAEALSTSWNEKALMVGVEFGWFVHDFWKLNIAGGVNIATKPGYAGLEGTIGNGSWSDNIGEIPNYNSVDAKASLAYTAAIGIDRYFKVRNVKNLMMYTGLRFGMAYGSNEIRTDKWEILGKSVAETWNMRAALTFGVDYFVMPSMYIGVSVDPFAYTYGVTSYKPQEGLNSLSADVHDYSAFAAPTIRLGFVF